ncbi:MAG: oligosaccharide flippase family protein [Solirubrobacteraceae bacterium]
MSAEVLDTPQAGPLALRGSALRTGAYFGGVLLSLLSAPLLIRHLHQVGFGRYITVLSIIAIVSGLTEGGLNALALREYTTLSGTARERLMANMLGLRLTLSSLGALAAVAFAALAGYPGELVLGTAVASVAMILRVTQSLLAVPLQGSMRFGWVSLVDLVQQAVAVALIVALVVAGAGLVGFVATAIPAALLALLLTARLVRRLTALRPSLEPQVFLPLLRAGLPYAIAVALNNVYFRLTVVLLSLSASQLQTGYFATSFRIVELLIALPALIVGAAYPILSRAERDDADRFAYATRRLFELSILAGALLALWLELGAGFAIDLLGGHEAAPAAAVLRIQGLAVLGTFVAVACTFPMLSLRRHRELMLANAIGLIVTVVLTLVLVPELHARGAAIATVGAEFSLALVTAISLARASPGLGLPLSAIPVAALAGGLGVLAGRLVGVQAIVEVLAGTLVYFGVLVALRRFPPEVRDALR